MLLKKTQCNCRSHGIYPEVSFLFDRRDLCYLFCFDGFDDIYQKRSSRFDKKIRLAALQTESTGSSFVFYPCLLFSFCQDNSTLRLSRTIKKATSEQPFGFSVVFTATFQPFVFNSLGR
jgi:hypothetical protein